jgi:hypothetical protein
VDETRSGRNPNCLPNRLPDCLPEFRYAELALKIEAEPNFEAKKSLALFGLAGSSLNTARTGGSSPQSLSPNRAGSPQRTHRSPVGTHRSSAEFMEPGELAEEGEGPVGKGPVEGEGPVGKGPVEGEGPVGIAAEPEAAPEATPIEAAAEEAKAAAEEAAEEEAEEAKAAEEEAAAAEEEAAAEDEEEEALVFLALAPSTSTLRNDEETRARVRALTTAPCTNGSPCMHALHARPSRHALTTAPCTNGSPCMHALHARPSRRALTTAPCPCPFPTGARALRVDGHGWERPRVTQGARRQTACRR